MVATGTVDSEAVHILATVVCIPTPARDSRFHVSVTILLKRAYDTPSRSDVRRILVERLWPRGVSKQHAKIDLWLKEAARSTELRQCFNHDPDRWVGFKRKYFRELDSHEASVHPILERVRAGPVTFMFASRELRFNNAVALKEYLERLR